MVNKRGADRTALNITQKQKPKSVLFILTRQTTRGMPESLPAPDWGILTDWGGVSLDHLLSPTLLTA